MPKMPTRCRYFSAARCKPGMRIEGPAIIEEQTSTTVLYPGQQAEVDEYLNVDMALRMGCVGWVERSDTLTCRTSRKSL